MSWDKLGALLWTGFLDTLYMTIPATLISYLIGMPLGILLVITRKGHIKPAPAFNAVLGAIINFLRSVPFIILLAMLFPVTRVVMGTAIGTRAVIFPLIISAFPYVARMVESSFMEVDRGIIEAGGGGLGAIAITKGLNTRKYDVMYAASLAIVALVQIFTVLGTRFSRRLDHRIR